jgi:two-component system, LuxR family, response regulator FixJ
MAENIVLHVIDDDEAMRDSIAFLLGTSGFEVKAFDSAIAFLEALSDLDVTCVVTDVRMPQMDGLEMMKRLKASGRHFPVIIMTAHGDVPLAVEAMKLGAFDFLEKPFDDDALLTTVNSAIRHGNAAAAGEAETRKIEVRIKSLTPRERQVLERLVAGQSNKLIGHDLAISPRTVEIYRANVMTKMQASSVPELVRLAIRSGIGAV